MTMAKIDHIEFTHPQSGQRVFCVLHDRLALTLSLTGDPAHTRQRQQPNPEMTWG